jgi:diacylglycerol kinase (ATP)
MVVDAAPRTQPRTQPRTGTIAVLAHREKSLGGGLGELRAALAEAGYPDPLWYEVDKSRKASKKARAAAKQGARLVFVWGGDGMVQRSLDALAGSGIAVAILPAGTANLLATNLGVPHDLAAAVHIGLDGARRKLDLGRINGEHFAVMAGAGFDGAMVRDTDRKLKGRLGNLAYVAGALRHVGDSSRRVRIRVDGDKWFTGKASCVLFGNVGTATGGLRLLDDARPDDGWLNIGVATAEGAVQWARTLGRVATGHSEKSSFVRTTRARKVDVRFDKPTTYELDGGERSRVSRLKVRVVPRAIEVCVPGRPGGLPPAT